MTVRVVDGTVEPDVRGPASVSADGDTVVVRVESTSSASASTRGSGVNVVIAVGLGGDRVEVRVSPGTALDARLDAGGLRLEGLDGPLDVEVAAGSVKGEISVTSDARVHVGTGKVELSLRHGSDPALLDATVDVGRVRVV